MKIGASSLLLSVIIHVGLLLLAQSVVFVWKQADPSIEFLPGGGTIQEAQASADLQHQLQQKKQSALHQPMSVKKLVSTSLNAMTVLPVAWSAPMTGVDGGAVDANGGFGSGGAGGGFGKGIGLGAARGFTSLPPSMSSRCSPQERLEKLRQNGGTPECEAAVSAALEWLKSRQNEDGSWGSRYRSAYTGLALLCYLGRCETPESSTYGNEVLKGLMFLMETQKQNPRHLFSQAAKGNAPVYEHGIATYALGEMYMLSRPGSSTPPGLREAFEQGVKIIIDHQEDSGSWAYDSERGSYADGKSREDLSVTGWQFQALKAASNSGLEIDGLPHAIRKSIWYLESKQTKDGGFGGPNRRSAYNQWSLSGVGILGLQTLSTSRVEKTRKGIQFLRSFLTAEPLDWNKNCNLYSWYYYTQAFFQQGGDDWKFYHQQLLPVLLGAQQADGSFKRGRASWPAADAADEIYRQCLCILQLEVFYRYLKVGDREEVSFFDR